MPIKHLRVKIPTSVDSKFRKLLPDYGQRSRAVRRFVRIFVEECERNLLAAPVDLVDDSALQAIQETLAEEEER